MCIRADVSFSSSAADIQSASQMGETGREVSPLLLLQLALKGCENSPCGKSIDHLIIFNHDPDLAFHLHFNGLSTQTEPIFDHQRKKGNKPAMVI